MKSGPGLIADLIDGALDRRHLSDQSGHLGRNLGGHKKPADISGSHRSGRDQAAQEEKSRGQTVRDTNPPDDGEEPDPKPTRERRT